MQSTSTDLKADQIADDHPTVSFIRVTAEQAGQRLDNWLMARLRGVPRSLIYRIIRSGEVRINRGRAQAQTRLQANDEVRIPPLRVATPAAPVIGTALADSLLPRIVYRESGLIVLNKPAGLAVHGGSGLNFGVIEALRQALQQPRLELVHRLDRETSGLLMVAEKRSVLRELQQYLREGRIDKRYLALAKGHLSQREQLVTLPLQKYELPHGERRVRVSSDGKPSQTRLIEKQRFGQGANAYSWIEARPLTGRTHQIRVHTLALGHPLLGDDKYGHEVPFAGKTPPRLALHAAQLNIPDRPLLTALWPDELAFWIR